MTKSECRIGFVGVGRMGANMARHLKDEAYQITAIYDINMATTEALSRELHCEAAKTPSMVADLSNVVFTVVTDDQAMREIYSEAHQESLLRHATGRLFINCATITPQAHIEIEGLVEKHGGQSLEACLASSITQARDGTLYLMCGGKQEAFRRAEPLLKTLSASLRYIGTAGKAAQVKALVNMLMNINTAGLAEGLGLGDALGLDLTMLRDVFAHTGAASKVLDTDGEDMQQRAHDCYFSAAHAAKDSGIALTLARQMSLRLPLAEASYDQYRRLVELGKGELDKSGIAELTFKDRA